jgi:cytidine deaminase
MEGMIHEVKFTFQSMSRDNLTPEELQDLAKAGAARQEAKANESRFLVGAVIRTEDGRVWPGWNVENGVQAGLHAEENALGRIELESRKAGIRRVTVIGGDADAGSDSPVAPCGICRQKLVEFIQPGEAPMVIMAGTRGMVLKCALRDLLPLAFNLGDFQK